MNGTGLWELLLVLISGVGSPALFQVRRADSGRNFLNISIEIQSRNPVYPFSQIIASGRGLKKRIQAEKKRSPGKALWIKGWLMPQSMRISILCLFLILHYFLFLHNADVILHKCLNFLSSCQILYISNTSWEWVSHICYNLPIPIRVCLCVRIF